MSSSTDILILYREFTEALTEVLAENAAGPARRGPARDNAVFGHHNWTQRAAIGGGNEITCNNARGDTMRRRTFNGAVSNLRRSLRRRFVKCRLNNSGVS